MTPIIARTPSQYDAGGKVLREYLRWARDHAGVDLSRERRVADEAWRTAAVYGPPHGALVVAFAGFRPVGAAGLVRVAPSLVELRRMYVRPALRRRGIGFALLACAVQEAEQRGFALLHLDTAPAAMPAAHRLYARAGFRETAPRSLRHPGAVGMRLWLRGAREAIGARA